MSTRNAPVRRPLGVGGKARLSDLVRKALLGEEVVIAKDNKPLVRPINQGL